MPKITLNHNNVSITYDEDNPPDIEVYRCPHLKCKEFYFTQADLDSHKVLGHAQMPKSLTNIDQFKPTPIPSIGGTSHFSIEKLNQVKKLNSKQTMKHYGFMLHLMLGKDPTKMPKVKGIEPKDKMLTAKVAEPKPKPIEVQKRVDQPPQPSLWDKVVEKFKGYVRKRTKLYA